MTASLSVGGLCSYVDNPQPATGTAANSANRSGTRSTSQNDASARLPASEMVSFGFLDENEERPPPTFAFASLFDRMRAAFSAPSSGDTHKSDYAPATPARRSSPPRRRISRHGTPAQRQPSQHLRKANGIVPLRTLSPSVTIAPTNVVSTASDVGSHAATVLSDTESVDTRQSDRGTLGTHGVQAVPGFPLSGDILDDTRSVTTIHRSRSDAGDDSLSTMSVRPSADIWIRRFRGEGLSRKYWMADETAKECRDCLMPFTSLRRKHHCRICGQIFCHRCASNLVPGERWGHKGSIRTCNQCKNMLEEYDHRERIDAEAREASFLQEQSPMSSSMPEVEAQDLHTPLSQFAAKTLFSGNASVLPRRCERYRFNGESDDDGNDDNGDMSDERLSHEQDVNGFQSYRDDEFNEMPEMDGRDVEALRNLSAHDPVLIHDEVPFRSGLVDESDVQAADESITADMVSSMIPASRNTDEMRHMRDSDLTENSRYTDEASRSGDNGFKVRDENDEENDIVCSKSYQRDSLTEPPLVAHDDANEEPLPPPCSPIKRSTARQKLMRGASRFVTSTALSAISLVYFLRMLHQLLLAEHIGHVHEWKETIKLLALAVIERIRVRTRNTYLTDIRHFVKIKCFPGGHVSDCEFLDGFVCTKNVATKPMASFLPMRNARIMIITFPIEYHRNADQLMSLESIMAQEYEFLRILVARIVAQRPNVVMVQKGVSHIALEMFEKAGIAVFLRMKRTALETIAHCTQADIIASIDRLALEPRLGRCAAIFIDTYQQVDDAERRKPLLRVEVTSKEVSSALVLRGALLPKLRRIKAILALMVFVGYNLKLEDFLRHDLGALLEWSAMNYHSVSELPASIQADESEIHRRIILDETLKKYQRLLLSASVTAILPPPFLVTRMKQVTDRIHTLRAEPFEQVTTTHYPRNDGEALAGSNLVLCAPCTYRAATEQAILESEHESIQACWHACVSGMSKMLTPFAHQKLVALVFKTCAATLQTCTGPDFVMTEFYGLNDEPLGQFLERTCFESAMPCDSRHCESSNLVHYLTFVHNTTRIQMVVEQFPCPLAGSENELLCWSYCKVCESTTPITHLSDAGWSVSFAKFLELQCYPNAACHSSMCPHDYFRDNVRYFALKNLAIRFHADPITPWHIVVPPSRLVIHHELMCELRNAEVIKLYEKNLRYWRSVCGRLTALRDELHAHPIYSEAPLTRIKMHADDLLEQILQCASTDCAEVEERISQAYWHSDKSPLKMNEVRRFLQDRVVEWEGLFLDFEKRSTVTERDVRRLMELYRRRLQSKDADVMSVESDAQLDTPTDRKMLEFLTFLDGCASYDKDSTKHRNEETQRMEDSKLVSVSIDSHASKERQSSLEAPRTKSRADAPSKDSAMTSAIAAAAVTTGTAAAPATPASATSATAVPMTMLASRCGQLQSEDQKPAQSRGQHQNPSTRSSSEQSPREDQSHEHSSSQAHPIRDSRPASQDQCRISTPGPMPKASTLTGHASSMPSTTHKPASRAQEVSQKRHAMSNAFDSPASASNISTQTAARQDVDPATSSPTAYVQRSPPASIRRKHMSEYGSMSPSSEHKLADSRTSPQKSSDQRDQTPRSTPGVAPLSSPASSLGHSRPTSQLFSSQAAMRGESMVLRPPWNDSRPKINKPRRDVSTRSQVAILTRQYEQLSRDAELERDRLASRIRRTRPATTTHATVEVFKSLRDAVKGDESDGEDEGKQTEQAHAERRGEAWLGKDAGPGSALHPFMSTPEASAPVAGEAVALTPNTGGLTRASTSPVTSAEPAASAESLGPGSLGATSEGTLATTPLSNMSMSTDPRGEAPQPSDTGYTQASVQTAPARKESTNESESVTTPHSDSEEALPERARLFRLLEATWTLHVGELVPLKYPFVSTDHVFTDARVVVREDEPSSIIAFTLDSKSYREQLAESRKLRTRDVPDAAPDMEQELRITEGSHYLYEFDTGSIKLWCKIFFAEQFDALRHMCGCAELFVQSLSRCFKWDSRGGKSGSAFLKTCDDRFVVKQLSRTELDGFSKFAPQYFTYLADCKSASRPTTLTKIFGYFRIGFKNMHTGKGFKMDLMAMENLLYGRSIDKIFDLKGSTRNRYVQETGRAGEVLLDENLVHDTRTNPFLVREHSKRILRTALYNDSLFLTEMNVMDYSLILALDSKRNEMVIGIIDYLRTYTWDKRVESFVKETAILGGGGKGEPTIITPRQYRMRFLTFLDRNILMTPDPWVQSGWVQ